MDAKRWERIQELFGRALEAAPEEREAIVRAGAAGDEAVAAEVLSLLDADTGDHSLLDAGAGAIAGELAGGGPTAGDGPSRLGTRIGAWRLVSEIGRGGMGSVYLAERADGEFQAQVALKIIRRGMDSDEILRRFRGERQILARLDHPNIARFLDGGLTDDGVPWFTMEHVDGVPIDRYCDERVLSIDDRLTLFDAVCRAVAYAQRNLVVHRDLKPGNILVTAAGEVKLLDFGIAKLLDDGEDAGTPLVPGGAARTRTGHRVMTPGYAAPEQVRGESATTATDVYALGVILYELLTGQRPYAPQDTSPQALERAIIGDEPTRPSTVVTKPGPAARPGTGDTTSPDAAGSARRARPAQLRKQLAGDLDNICLMALRKEPERRYGSAEQLADDVRRFRSGHPVVARGDTTAYRVRKFVGRNRAAVAATGAVLAVVVALVSFYTSQLAHERDRARLEAEKARSVSTFLTGLFEVSDPSESLGETITARELLDRGARRIDDELRGQPEVRATMMTVVGTVYSNLGLYAKADSLLTTALADRDALREGDDADLAGTLGSLGRLRITLGDNAGADSLLQHALGMNERLFGPVSEQFAESARDLSWLRAQQARYDEAESLLRRSVSAWEKMGKETDRRSLLAMADLALLLQEQGKHDAAEAMFRRVVPLQRDTLGQHPDLSSTLFNFSEFLRGRDRLEEAEAALQEAMEIDRKVLGDDHPDVAYDLLSLARIRRERYDYEGAKALFREVMDMRRRSLGDEHTQVARSLADLGGIALAQGRYEEADSLLTASMEMHRRVDGPEHTIVSDRYRDLGRVAVARGRYDEAVKWSGMAAELRKKVWGADNPKYAETLMYHARALSYAGRDEEATRESRRSLAITRSTRGEDDRETFYQLHTLGWILSRAGQTDEAESLLRDALRKRTAMYGADDPIVAAVQHDLGVLLRETGRAAEADVQLRHALVTRRDRLPSGNRNTAETLVELGRALRDQGRADEGRRDAEEGVAMLRRLLPKGHPALVEAEESLAAIPFGLRGGGQAGG